MKNKTQIMIAVLTLLSLVSPSQSKKYKELMKKNITLLDSAKKETDYFGTAAAFEKLSTVEKKDWLPNYYAGMSYVMIAFEKEGEEIDTWCDKADRCIAKADSLSKNNSEIFVLKAMAATSRIMVNPMARGMQYGKEAYDCSQKAMEIDPNNPRAYANKGQGTFYTPEAFGGGAAKAKPHLEKAVERYKTFKPASEIHPNWGKRMSEDLLKKCNEKQD